MADRNALSIVIEQPTETQGPVAQFRDMHRRWIEGQSLTPSQVAILVDGFGGYLDAVDAGERASLDWSFGLKAWGGLSVAKQDRLARRDTMIRNLWRVMPDWQDQQPVTVARLMAIDAARYERQRWPRERAAPPPAQPAATWWAILDEGLPIPGMKRLQQILEQPANEHASLQNRESRS